MKRPTPYTVLEESVIRGDGEEETTRAAHTGFFLASKEGFSLLWKEGEGKEETRIEVTVAGDRITVLKRGAVSSRMVFRKGEPYTDTYSVPPCTFDLKIETHRIDVLQNKDGGRVSVICTRTVGGVTADVDYRLTFGKEAKP